MEMGGYFYRFSLKRNDPQIPATLSTPCDIIGQKAAFFEFFSLAPKLAMSKKSSKIKGLRDRKKYFCEYLTHSDDLGRVVIPKEIRKTLRIKEGTPLEIFTDREGQIILKKYSPIGELNTFAAEYAEALVQTTGLTACITDRDQVVAACGSGSRELEGKEISSDLDAVIAGRKGRMVSQDSRENISLISDAMDSFCQKMIQPILCASDAIGAVILLTKSEKTALGDTERALVRTAAGFLGRQMEQ